MAFGISTISFLLMRSIYAWSSSATESMSTVESVDSVGSVGSIAGVVGTVVGLVSCLCAVFDSDSLVTICVVAPVHYAGCLLYFVLRYLLTIHSSLSLLRVRNRVTSSVYIKSYSLITLYMPRTRKSYIGFLANLSFGCGK